MNSKEEVVANLVSLQQKNNKTEFQIKEDMVGLHGQEKPSIQQPQENVDTKKEEKPKTKGGLWGWLIIGPLLLGLLVFGAAAVIFGIGYE